VKTIVEIELDEPKEQAWLCAENIQLALSAYCANTKFKVIEKDAEITRLRDALDEIRKETSDNDDPFAARIFYMADKAIEGKDNRI
jgi:hypothetical protein